MRQARSGTIALHQVDVAAVRPLRLRVLRPGLAADSVAYAGDDLPGTLHAAVFDGDAVVCVGTAFAQACPGDPQPTDWRLRGMATAPEHQGRGYGRLLMGFLAGQIRQHKGRRLWCDARAGAVGYYVRQGFVAVGGAFELPVSGTHYRMLKPLVDEA
ncbi:GNAT family N-acetyltransferase [Xanthomonas sp. AmX2]|uniref:GNAT family N-acetyltransferase n=1 Tax=Xanthomonas sp. TaxID=29446 RepID=UPI001981EF56|nr:GNAT family N-acetyltransferase [Xanthomonas sp.]MBN6151134.1 GNAT family N-acetyltransferase [Xanthomonas sp.]